MFSDSELLKLLAKPGYHSGSDLGRTLGVSRVAIQKRIANLRLLGLPVSRVHGRGYSLKEGISLLDRDIILSLLDDDVRGSITRFDLLQSVASTSEYVSGIDILPGEVLICLAEAQTAGRGRRGRSWVATPYRNILFTLSWCFDSWPGAMTGLSLAAGIEIANQLKVLGLEEVRLKWPNDIVCGPEKLGGILIDVRGEANAGCRIDLGLGLNISMGAGDTSEIDQPWTDLEALGFEKIDRNRLAARFIGAWIHLCKTYATEQFAPYREAWTAFDVYADATVEVESSGETYSGRVRGVTDTGALIVRDDQGRIHALSDAETSIRIQQTPA